MEGAGYNTFLLRTRDVFLDMLTDSGTNAMSDNQLGAMMASDDAYAGSESFYRLQDAVKDVLGFNHTLPVHQGRAAENLLSKAFVKPGDVVPMNYHFTTTKAHIDLNGGQVLELYTDEALKTDGNHPFRGNMDVQKLKDAIAQYGAERVPYVRMEATTNLIGGQPFSMANLRGVRRQPHLRERLPHQAAGSRLCRQDHRPDHGRTHVLRGHPLHVRPQERRGARRPDRHQQRGVLHTHSPLAARV